MRTLRKTDIESMERELRVLENPKGILGGYSYNDWSCLFNCMEYIGRGKGFTHDDDYYCNVYLSLTGHNPTDKGMYTDQIENLFFNAGFGCNAITGIRDFQVNGNQVMLIPGANGKNHAVVITSVSGGKVNYYDPTTNETGSAGGNEIIGIYDTDPIYDYVTPPSGSSSSGYFPSLENLYA